MWTIRQTENGWEVVCGEGDTLTVVDTFDSYEAALAAIAERITAELAVAVAEGETSDDGLLPEGWMASPAICYSAETGDGRDFTSCTWTARDPSTSVLPLMLQTETEMAHFGAQLAGFLTEVANLGTGVNPTARGRFYDNEAGRQARDLLLGGRRFGVSVDPGAVEAEFICVEEDDEGWCLDARIEFSAYEIIGVTMTPFPGFAEAAIALDDGASSSDDGEGVQAAASGAELQITDHEFEDNGDGFCAVCVEEDDEGCVRICGAREDEHGEADAEEEDGDEDEGEASVRASASLSIPTRPPAAWFAMPEPRLGQSGMVDVYGMPVEELLVEQEWGGLAVPLTILDDGRVFGHVAGRGACHVGFPNECVQPPESACNYAHFHVGEVVCAGGERIPTGALVAGCDHAASTLRAPEARDFYAHNGIGWADVRIVEGEWGPWACGALRPDVTEQQLRVYRAGALSGDWRRLGGALELISVLAVNAPGFRIARNAVLASGLPEASLPRVRMRVATDAGTPLSLTASGVVARCRECQRRAADEAARLSVEGGRQARRTAASTTYDPALNRLPAMVEQLGEQLRVLERRTRHLRQQEADAITARIRSVS